jgi:hypothetical protein
MGSLETLNNYFTLKKTYDRSNDTTTDVLARKALADACDAYLKDPSTNTAFGVLDADRALLDADVSLWQKFLPGSPIPKDIVSEYAKLAANRVDNPDMRLIDDILDRQDTIAQHLPYRNTIAESLCNPKYLRARNFTRRDPLAIDLDGDGIETVGVPAGVLFDHNADGIKTGTGWLKGDDAFLVLDRNGNGTIDSGRELFGVDTVLTDSSTGKDGFAALTDLDGNGDKVFNALDAQFANVRLWRDLNQDGVSQTNELQTLSSAGITAINLSAHAASKTLAGGNTLTLTADVAGLGNEAATALNLADNPFYREFPDHLDTTAVATLPDMLGSGLVRDLREAATLSSATAQHSSRTAPSGAAFAWTRALN